MNKQQYPTDMTDSQWDIIQQMIPPAKLGGRPRSLDVRQVINAILYIVVGGIQWRLLSKEYPKLHEPPFQKTILFTPQSGWDCDYPTLRSRHASTSFDAAFYLWPRLI